MKKLLFLFSFLLLIQTPVQAQIKLITPPLPKTNEVAIVVLKNPQTEQQIRTFLAPYKNIKLRHVFTEAINGFSIEGDIAQLISQTGTQTQTHVKDEIRVQIEAETQTQAEAQTEDKTQTKAESQTQTKSQPKAQPNSQIQTQILPQILSISPVNQYSAQMEESVKIIGAEEVRRYFDDKNARLTGKGVTVGVIDTGVDYTHPDLSRNFGGGKDLVDNDKDPMETRAHGHATLHGTHVAGIIAANGKIQGVAPEAKIIAYRALGPGGGGTTEQVLAAIEQAIKDKVDIINLSLGNEINGPDLPLSLALNKAVDKGVVAVVANGNSGPNVWTVGSPGTATKAISVGASTPTLEIPNLIIEEKTYKLQPMEGSAKWELDRSIELIDGGLGTKAELSDAQGKIVLIKRGRLTFTQKAKNALDAGAKAVIIYNNMSGTFIGNLESALTIPVASIAMNDGELIKRKLPLLTRLNINVEKDRLAEFSSRGPVTGTWEIKPDLVAPGVAINSTVPGGYLSLQGTSMAAPHVAGACALIKQAHPDWTSQEIKAALMNTAQPLQQPYHTYEQGAGRIQVDEAVKATSLVMPSSLKFGKFTDNTSTHQTSIIVKNTSSRAFRYSFDIPVKKEGLSWRFPLPFTLEPKQSKTIKIELAVDAALFKQKLHDGYLTLNSSGTRIQIPYIYVLEEPNYPRVMGFHFGEGDKPNLYQYEVYLPGGAEEFGIALFNPEDYRFVGFLDTGRNLKKGMIHKVLNVESLTPGTYRAKVFVKKLGKEDYIETMITVEKK